MLDHYCLSKASPYKCCIHIAPEFDLSIERRTDHRQQVRFLVGPIVKSLVDIEVRYSILSPLFIFNAWHTGPDP